MRRGEGGKQTRRGRKSARGNEEGCRRGGERTGRQSAQEMKKKRRGRKSASGG